MKGNGMAVSRRTFLEVSALSATGMVLENLTPSANARGELPQLQNAVGTGDPRSGFSPRLQIDFDHDWSFFRPRQDAANPAPTAKDGPDIPTDAEWESVTLPHSVRLEPRDVSGGRNYQGVCWYKKEFSVKPEWNGRILYLNFQGAMQVAEVWLNGIHLTTHYGGYIPFTVDITKAARAGAVNELTVRLNNSDNPEVPPGKPQSELDFVYFGGLYRSVQMQVLNQLHVTDPILADKVAGGGIFVTYPAVSSDESTVQVQTDILNETDGKRTCSVVQELIDPDGKSVVSTSQETTIKARDSIVLAQKLQVRAPRLWHPDDPQLYWLRTSIVEAGKVIDEEYSRVGIRSFKFEKNRGLTINGKPFLSIGANRHQDHPYVGYALPPSAHFRDAYKLREAGFTSYRSHYPQDPSFMDACDELGILAIVSNPGWQFVGDDVFKGRVYQGAREMIRRDRNRPSVLIWEAALNESDNSSIASELYRIAHEEHPGPECYTAGDPIHKRVDGFDGWDVCYVGRGPEDESKPGWIREWGDQVDNWSDQQGRVRVSRDWGETPMLVQASSHMLSLDRIYSAPGMPAGADLWAGIDAYRGYHHQAFMGAPMDLFRLPKFDYFMFQSQRPPEVTPAGIGSGPMVFIANFASFHSPSLVTVFSNCEKVRLYQNGKEIATQAPDGGYRIPHPPFTFKVGDFSSTRNMLFASGVAPSGTEIGELKAEGLIGGKVAATQVIYSPGVPKKIELRLDRCGKDPIADGADWVRVYAHVCDARGTTYPYGDDLVTFSVIGEGTLIGGQAIGANPVRAEGGIATGLVRTTRVAGKVTVRADAPGLDHATLQFESQKDATKAFSEIV
jgi:beta-galactosidase